MRLNEIRQRLHLYVCVAVKIMGQEVRGSCQEQGPRDRDGDVANENEKVLLLGVEFQPEKMKKFWDGCW